MARAGKDSEDKSHRAQEEIERLGGELLSRDQIIQALREDNQSKDAQVNHSHWCILRSERSLGDKLKCSTPTTSSGSVDRDQLAMMYLVDALSEHSIRQPCDI